MFKGAKVVICMAVPKNQRPSLNFIFVFQIEKRTKYKYEIRKQTISLIITHSFISMICISLLDIMFAQNTKYNTSAKA